MAGLLVCHHLFCLPGKESSLTSSSILLLWLFVPMLCPSLMIHRTFFSFVYSLCFWLIYGLWGSFPTLLSAVGYIGLSLVLFTVHFVFGLSTDCGVLFLLCSVLWAFFVGTIMCFWLDRLCLGGFVYCCLWPGPVDPWYQRNLNHAISTSRRSHMCCPGTLTKEKELSELEWNLWRIKIHLWNKEFKLLGFMS